MEPLFINEPKQEISIDNLISTIIIDVNTHKHKRNIIDIKSLDKSTFAHSVSVTSLALQMGIAMDMNYKNLYELGVGALLHDIGKLFTPSEILNKKGKLTFKEMSIMKEHSKLGYEYIKSNNSIPRCSKLAILEHHERMDGTGYPDNKVGSEIHEFTKIVTICDVYDAINSKRVYKRAQEPEKAMGFIMENINTAFDEDLVHIFKNQVYPTRKL